MRIVAPERFELTYDGGLHYEEVLVAPDEIEDVDEFAERTRDWARSHAKAILEDATLEFDVDGREVTVTFYTPEVGASGAASAVFIELAAAVHAAGGDVEEILDTTRAVLEYVEVPGETT